MGFLLTLIVALFIPNEYVSTTRLMPPEQNSSGMAMLAAMAGSAGTGFGGLAGDLLGMKSTGALFVGILESRTVQDAVISKFDLRKVYRHRKWQDTREELSRNTGIVEDRKSGIISVSVTDKSPVRAASIAQEYVDELNRVITELNTSSAHRERVFLEDRLVKVKQDLESSEKEFGQFASKNTAIDIQAQGKAMIEAAATLEGQSIAAQTELESLKQIYADGNVRVRATQARVNELQRQLEKLGGSPGSATELNGKDDASSYPSIRKLPLLGVSYADLYRNMKVQETIFETLTKEYELAKVEEAKETPSVKVIDPPDVPERKSSPHRLWIVLSGTFLALAFGTVWILGDARWGQISPDDPGKAFALEVFGTLKTHFSLASRNGSGSARANEGFWKRLRGGRQSATGNHDPGELTK
jgi:capsule polysaccharide export protein KpsE/RkpR